MQRAADRSDAQLVAQVVTGDEAALAELYDRYAQQVFLVAFRRLGDRGLAEEVMQETYLALWNRAELFDPRVGSLPAWLSTIARNRSVDRLRALGRRPPAIGLSAITGDEGDDDRSVDRLLSGGVLLGSAPPAAEPEAVLDEAWLRETVRSALDDVPVTERQVITLAYYEELTQVEIAQRLGWPLGTVKTRTRRALARLRELLADRLGPELGPRVAPAPIPLTTARATRADGGTAPPTGFGTSAHRAGVEERRSRARGGVDGPR